MKSNDITLQDLREYLENIFYNTVKSKKDTSIMFTGKPGLILYLETLKNRPLTQEEKDNIEPGVYRISSVLPYIVKVQ